MYFLLKNGYIPASYVSLPEGNLFVYIYIVYIGDMVGYIGDMVGYIGDMVGYIGDMVGYSLEAV